MSSEFLKTYQTELIFIQQSKLHAVRFPAELFEAAVLIQSDQQRGGSQSCSCGSTERWRRRGPKEKGGKKSD